MAAEYGANFVDLNCGCPIHEATKRGLGSALLRRPERLGELVRGLVVSADSVGLPLTVKVRLGRDASSVNVLEVARVVRDAGAAAVSVHGRTALQGYSKPADWDLIRDVAEELRGSGCAVVGNGDVLTHVDASRRFRDCGVGSVMVGRGALIKPWVFQEHRDGRAWDPEVEERVGVYRTLALHMKDHFGDDVLGRRAAWNFLPWHFDFFRRYVPVPEGSDSAPAIQNRNLQLENATPLEYLLSHRDTRVHDLIASALWESDSDANAVFQLESLAGGDDFARIRNSGPAEDDGNGKYPDDEELANVPSSSSESGGGGGEAAAAEEARDQARAKSAGNRRRESGAGREEGEARGGGYFLRAPERPETMTEGG